MADLIIKGGIVLTMDSAFIDNGTVVVDNGLITYVGKDTKEKADKVIDARDCAVMPGFINSHTHVPMTLFRGYADGLSYGEWIKKDTIGRDETYFRGCSGWRLSWSY